MKRAAALALGWFLVALGIAGLFLPLLQGLLLIAAGLLVLSRNSRSARAWVDRLRRRRPGLDRALRRLERRPKREHGPGEVASPEPSDSGERVSPDPLGSGHPHRCSRDPGPCVRSSQSPELQDLGGSHPAEPLT